LVYGDEYRWFVNVTDGTHWARKMYSFTTGYPSPFDPFAYGWQYRKQISIDHTQVSGTLVNFPILLSTTDSDFMKTQTDGDDLLFMNGVGEAIKLPYDLEMFNQTTGNLLAWVNIHRFPQMRIRCSIYIMGIQPVSRSRIRKKPGMRTFGACGIYRNHLEYDAIPRGMHEIVSAQGQRISPQRK